MKAIVLEHPGHFSLIDQPEPADLAPDHARVRVHCVGVCGTDLHAYRGRQPFFNYPRILGHELGVTILTVPDNPRGLKVGDRCAVEPYLNCGSCVACLRGKPNCCENIQVLGVHTDGGLRPIIDVPVTKLHKSNQLSLDQLALVETLGIGAHAVARSELVTDETALVVGLGPIGLTVVQFALLAGAKVLVRDQSAARLAFCQRLFPAVNVAEENDLNKIAPHVVFDATGNVPAMQHAVELAAPGGRVVYVGLVQGQIAFTDAAMHRKELSIIRTRNALPDDFTRIIDHIEQGRIDTSAWITHRTDMAGMIAQFDRWLDPQAGVIKAMVDID